MKLADVRKQPYLLFAIACAIAAILFARVAAGTVAACCAFAMLGAWVAPRWPEWRARVSTKYAGWIALGFVLVFAIFVFAPTLAYTIDWQAGDWSGQRVALQSAIEGLRHGHLPHWSSQLITGDAPLELYPALTYIVEAVAAFATGMTDELPTVMLATGVVIHVLIAIGATRLALRFVSAPIAAAVGILMVIDLGSVSSGGIEGSIRWGLAHTCMSQALFLFALVPLVDGMRAPRLRRSIAVWIFTALAVATHPSALLQVGVASISLGIVALLARDVAPRRAVVAIFHLGLGCALGAAVWLPLGTRLVMYGYHFSDALQDPAHWLRELFSLPMPAGSFAPLIYAGYAGAIAGLWSRRALPIFISTTVFLCLFARTDMAYLAFDLAPSQSIARLGSDRFYGLVRPFAFVAAAYMALVVLQHVRIAWADATVRTRQIAGALIAVCALAGVRIVLQTGQLMVGAAHDESKFLVTDTEPTVRWVRSQLAALPPGQYARAIFWDTSTYYLHLTAETGLPTLQLGIMPDVFIRERIEDDSPESLKRFAVRWAITDSAGPMPLGDPATERKIGRFRIRDITGWDGQLARVEKGAGTATVTHVSDEGFDVELTDTTAPALVSIGYGYYPRFRAVGPGGKALPVYAMPGTPKGKLHVLAAWLPPGVTHFSPDGPLPSDGQGLPLTVLAALFAVAATLVWLRPRWRIRVLRRAATGLAWLRARSRWIARGSLIAIVVAIFGWGLKATLSPAKDLELGTGARGTADVWVRKPKTKAWTSCAYTRVFGEYRCGGTAVAIDSTDVILNDEQPVKPYTTPAIYIRGHGTLEYRIRMKRRLAGRYWAGSRNGSARYAISGLPPMMTDHQLLVDIPDDGERDIVITGQFDREFWTTFVREDTLIPDRSVPLPPDHPAF